MPRLKYVKPDQAKGEVKKIFDSIKKDFGAIPNIFQGMAGSPVALKAYLALNEIINEGGLSEAEQEITRIAVSQYNNCEYCLAAHTGGAKSAGMKDGEIMDIRRGNGSNEKYNALFWFTQRIMETSGYVSDEDINKFTDAGYTKENIPEVITIIAQKTLSNYFNHVHETELDMPKAPELEMQKA
ncbi:MAG TPA: hypothetical protein ENO22_04660 [candidate division Zixibacteria bacterium]|nr:hypothetical protein [candidate division Zixibacteria bacterium]